MPHLVLTRKKNETIRIGIGGEHIDINVVEIRGDKVRLGINAAKQFPVDRLEIWEAKEREQRERDERALTKAKEPTA